MAFIDSNCAGGDVCGRNGATTGKSFTDRGLDAMTRPLAWCATRCDLSWHTITARLTPRQRAPYHIALDPPHSAGNSDEQGAREIVAPPCSTFQKAPGTWRRHRRPHCHSRRARDLHSPSTSTTRRPHHHHGCQRASVTAVSPVSAHGAGRCKAETCGEHLEWRAVCARALHAADGAGGHACHPKEVRWPRETCLDSSPGPSAMPSAAASPTLCPAMQLY